MSTKRFTTRHGIDANYQDIVSANTIYANTFNGSGTGLTSIPNSSLANSSVTINGTAISLGSSGSIVAGATITDDTSTNATRYVMLGTATSGSYTVANTSSTKLTYNPNSGILSATGFSGSGADLTGSATNLTANVATYEVINNATSGNYYPQMVSATSGTLAGYANNAFVFDVANGRFGIGTSSPYYKLEVNGTAKANSLVLTANTASTNTTTGTLLVTGGVGISGALNATTKSFDIVHPSDPEKRLRYGSLESPSHSVRLTGKGSVYKGTGIIRLPEYFKDLVHKEEINIQITNIRHGEILWVEEGKIEENYFVVGCNSEEDLEFYWSLTAERADVEKLVVEY